MDDFYQEMQGVAASIIGEFSQGKIEYVAITSGNGPADNPGKSKETVYAVEGVARGVSQKYIDKTSIVATDLQATIAGKVVKPDVTGFMQVDGVRHKILRVVAKPAAGTPVAFTVIFRK